jgi:hypothetical protein
VKAGGHLPTGPGEVIVQGEDLGAWIAGQRAGWDKLVPAAVLGGDARGRSRAERAAACAPLTGCGVGAEHCGGPQFHAREGHLRVPRQHVETVDGEALRLGSFVDNSRHRAAKLGAERRNDLEALGMRW